MKQIILSFLWVITFNSIIYAQSVKADHALLWEITSEENEKMSYLFGSFHSNDKRLFEFPDSMYQALNQVEGIALETDIFSVFDQLDTRVDKVRLKFDNKGQPYTNSTASSYTAYGNEDGMPQFLDAYFQQYAFNSGKKFHQLETVESQLEAFSEDVEWNDFSDIKVESLLMSKEELLLIYLEGDIYKIDQAMKSSLSLSKGMYESLIIDRNYGMVDVLDSVLSEGQSIFCAVGAGHLAGEEGMIELLKDEGYSVRKILATYSDDGVVGLDELEVRRNNYFTYQNDTLGFNVQFPGKPQEIVSEWEGDPELQLIYRDYGQGNTYQISVYPRDIEIGLSQLAEIHIASPANSKVRKLELNNGGEAYEGLSDTYLDGISWNRIVMGADHFFVLRAYGGNKFMNSPRAQRFFDRMNLED